jgi:organic radical activating enzyme
LKQKGIRTHIETSGAHPLSGQWDWICLSPKKFKAPLNELIQVAQELKVVVYNKSDFDWAEQYANQVNSNCLLYLQPEWSRANEINPMIVSYIKNHPQWALSLQTHKYLDIP